MKNTLQDVNNYLFEAIERLDDCVTDEELDREIKRARAVRSVAETIIDNGSLILDAQKLYAQYRGMDDLPGLPLFEGGA